MTNHKIFSFVDNSRRERVWVVRLVLPYSESDDAAIWEEAMFRTNKEAKNYLSRRLKEIKAA